jgi:desampylase
MIEILALPARLGEQLKRDAKTAFPRECCGLVEGVCEGPAASAFALHPASNLACEPDRFELDPVVHIALLRTLCGTGREIIGCYHSHPNGRPEPSPRDIAGAGEARFLWLIAALKSKDADPVIAAFVWTGSTFAPVIIESD